jgi:hypothetical protein
VPAQVLEVTQVGRAARDGPNGTLQLFAHTPKGGAEPAAHAELLSALQAAAAAGGGATVSPAGAQAPGLPPTASAGSFVRVGDPARNGSLPAALLAGFDAAFRGSAFQSRHDTLATLDADSIAESAAVLARAAYALALDGGGDGGAAAAALPVDPAAVKLRVQGLMQVGCTRGSGTSTCLQPPSSAGRPRALPGQLAPAESVPAAAPAICPAPTAMCRRHPAAAAPQCLLNSTVGLGCPLAAGLMSAAGGGRVGHYVGVLRTIAAGAGTGVGEQGWGTSRRLDCRVYGGWGE